MSRYREAWVGVAVVLAFAALMGGAVGSSGAEWPGGESGCIEAGECYCEAPRGEGPSQPANTVSNLAFVAFGLAVLVRVGRERGRRTAPDVPGRLSLYPVLFGFVAVFLGIGSAAFHGSLTEWSGWLDLVSMFALIMFVILYDLAMLRGWSERQFAGTYLMSLTALALVQWPLDNSGGKFIFGALIVVALAIEGAVAVARIERDRRWLWGSLATYGIAGVVWLSSRTEGPWCEPESLVQGHALWHILAAVSVALLYVYLRVERISVFEPSIAGATSPPD